MTRTQELIVNFVILLLLILSMALLALPTSLTLWFTFICIASYGFYILTLFVED